jgi:hypothetical protein
MLRVDGYRFYDLGVRLHPLATITDESLVAEVWFQIYQAKDSLRSVFTDFPLRVSRGTAVKLEAALVRVLPDDLTEAKWAEEETVGSRAFQIRQATVELETLLAAELRTFDTYFVSQKGSFSTPDLIDNAEIMLPEGIRQHLSANAIEDIRQSGKCLAFNLGTAASFHIARATEDVIRSYYFVVLGVLPSVKMRSWGTYHKNLSKSDKGSKKVLGWLDHIKDEYRNPVLHPDETVSPDAALVFINACSSLIVMMVGEMVRLNQAEAQLAFKDSNGVAYDAAIKALSAGFVLRQDNAKDTLSLEAGATETA